MIKQQLRPSGILDSSILSLFEQISREAFTPEPFKAIAYADYMIPLSKDQVMLSPILEAKILDSALDFYDRNEVEIIYLNVSDEWAIDLMHKRRRADDIKDHDILSRLNWFKMNVSPVLDYFRAHKSFKFNEINGEQPIEQVHQDILKALDLDKELDEL